MAGFRVDTNGRVDELLTDGTSLFVSGNFTTIGGVGRSRIAALDPVPTVMPRPGWGSTTFATGTEDTTFRPSFDRFMGGHEVHGDSSTVVVAGDFSVISGVRVGGFAIFPAGASTPFAASV